LTLTHNGGDTIALRRWADDLCDAMTSICEALDDGDESGPYSASMARVRGTIEQPEHLPSAEVLQNMRARGQTFVGFAMAQSEAHRRYFRAQALPQDKQHEFEAETTRSLNQQAEIEAADTLSFEDYLTQYFAQR
jgi:glutamate--cysteine ligase